MSTYSTNLALELIGTGEQAGTWGNTTNTNLGTLIEQAISGYVTQAVATGTDTTLTIPNGATGVARNMYIELTGTGGTNTNLIVPSNKKLYFIYNNSTGAVTVKVSGQTGVSVAATEKKILVSNGTDIVEATSYITAINSSLTLTTLNATSANITTLSGTAVNYGSATISSGNLTFSSTAQRITGDMSNATISNRLMVQTSTTNGNTLFSVMPNGTGTAALVRAFNSSTPAQFVDIRIDGTEAQLRSSYEGTSTFLPLTFYTGGSERMRLDTSGNLSLGASSLGFRCQISGDATNTLPTSWGQLVITGTNTAKQLMIGYDTTNDYGFLQATLVGTAYKNLVLQSGGGNVGIGTASPQSKLNVVESSSSTSIGGSTAVLQVGNSYGAALNVSAGIELFGSGAPSSGLNNRSAGLYGVYEAYNASGNAGALVLATNPAGTTSVVERMRIDSSGNVGIGTALPGTKLDVRGLGQFILTGAGTQTVLKLANDDTSGTSVVKAAFVSGGTTKASINAAVYGNDYMTFNVGSDTERMRIDSSGNVGIGGTASASTKLNILGTLPTSGASSLGFYLNATIPSGSTGNAQGFRTNLGTEAAAFTCGDIYHFFSKQAAFGAGSTVTNQYGFFADANLTGATNNYGFYSNIASGSNRWNFYAAGTAQNYFAGDTGIGRTPAASTRFTVKSSDNGSGTFAVYVENATPTELFKIRDDGTFFTGVAGNSPYNLTTGSAANVFVDTDGTLRRSTSSLRYKSDVTNATHGLADVLKLRSVTYKGKNDGEKVFGGLIAEEVHDAGLTEFVAYDKEGRPDALHYGNMVALLVKAIQELSAKVATLEAK